MLHSDNRQQSIVVSEEPGMPDVDFVYHYLRGNMYWAGSLTREKFDAALAGSAVKVGLYDTTRGGRQIGFARVVTDTATFAYLTDVFVVEEYRGRGLARLMMEMIMNHRLLQGLRRFLLVTEDAAGLYAKYGFRPLADAAQWMQIFEGGAAGGGGRRSRWFSSCP